MALCKHAANTCIIGYLDLHTLGCLLASSKIFSSFRSRCTIEFCKEDKRKKHSHGNSIQCHVQSLLCLSMWYVCVVRINTYHMTVVNSFHNLCKQLPGLRLFQALSLPDIVEKLSILKILHCYDKVRFCLET